MNGHIVELKASEHQAVQELLPWFVLDTLNSDERLQVHEHVQTCTQCQSDVDFQRNLTALERPDDAAVDVERAFATLRPRLTAQRRDAQPRAFAALMQNRWRGANRWWMQWALGAQFAAIAGLCFLLLQPEREAAYRGLGIASSASPNVVAVFKPQTTEQELRRILHASGARVVDGPTVTDAYLLKIEAGQQARALRLLRAEPAVVLAESLEGRAVH
jgi:hypothetical protein